MNPENIAQEIINSLVSKIADAAVAQIELKINAMIDAKLASTTGTDLNAMLQELQKSHRFAEIVNEAIDTQSIVDEVEGNIDVDQAVADAVRNLEFDITVR